MKLEWPLPIKGLNRGVAVDKTDKSYTDYCVNVLPIDAGENRIRLGKRPGMDKWDDVQIGASEQPVTCIVVVTTNE